MDEVAKWLVENRPPESGAALIHNDYKFDNVVLDANDLTKIVAVLDWEMCTLGDPLMDLGCTLAYWIQADDHESLKYFVPGPTFLPGNLTRGELIERYAATSGRDVEHVLFYYCYGFYKLAVIIQQIYARLRAGLRRTPLCRHESTSRQPEPLRRHVQLQSAEFLDTIHGGTFDAIGLNRGRFLAFDGSALVRRLRCVCDPIHQIVRGTFPAVSRRLCRWRRVPRGARCSGHPASRTTGTFASGGKV